MRPAAPLLPLLPALVLLPVALLLPGLLHGGGWDLVGQFLVAALRPSDDPLVLGSLLAFARQNWAAIRARASLPPKG